MVKEAKDQIAKMVRRAPRQETRRTRISRGRRRRRGRRRGRGGRRRGIDSFIHCLIQNDENPGFFPRFSIIFFSDTIQERCGNKYNFKTQEKDTSTKEVFHSYPTLEKNNYFNHFVLCKNNITMINNVA